MTKIKKGRVGESVEFSARFSPCSRYSKPRRFRYSYPSIRDSIYDAGLCLHREVDSIQGFRRSKIDQGENKLEVLAVRPTALELEGRVQVPLRLHFSKPSNFQEVLSLPFAPC